LRSRSVEAGVRRAGRPANDRKEYVVTTAHDTGVQRFGPCVSTGIEGLDEILGGGLPEGHMYLLEGESGAGKTTVGMQFLLEGRRLGERTLWISLSEAERELQRIARSHGWTLDGIAVVNPASPARDLTADQQYSFFSPGDVELDDIRAAIVAAVEHVRPSRVVFDPFSDIRHLARDVLRYRRQVLSLRELFANGRCTALLMQEVTRGADGDLQAEALVHGYITLHQDSAEYGGERRRLRVHKMRGIPFRGGYHDFCIATGGVEVYPRLIASEYLAPMPTTTAPSDVAALDALVGGGLRRGSSTLLMGPAGVGKSIIATQFAATAARRGEQVALFIFDETARAFLDRAERLGLDLRPLVDNGQVVLRQVDSAEFSAGQFTHMVVKAVERGADLVVIDSLSGYVSAMPEERFLTAHLHELLTYLSHRNVVTILTLAQHGILGAQVTSPLDISYLADTVLLLRYFEAFGAVRRAISVVKKRTGAHEVLVRELGVTDGGLHIGPPLADFEGVLTGNPRYTGSQRHLSQASE
jgi:circadian clock protein KaiC